MLFTRGGWIIFATLMLRKGAAVSLAISPLKSRFDGPAALRAAPELRSFGQNFSPLARISRANFFAPRRCRAGSLNRPSRGPVIAAALSLWRSQRRPRFEIPSIKRGGRRPGCVRGCLPFGPVRFNPRVNRRNDTIEICFNLGIFESQKVHSQGLQSCLSHFVIGSLELVTIAVDLHRQQQIAAEEIHDISINGFLPVKIETESLTALQLSPEQCL